MQSPNTNTPVSKDLELAAYATRMFEKFPDNPTLVGLAARMQGGAAELESAQTEYHAALRAILPTRVDVKFENHVADRRIRLTQQKAEMADGVRGGKIAGFVFPEGSAPITKLLGASQIEAMTALEARLGAAAAFWDEAAAEKAAIQCHRERYQLAITGRKKAEQKVREMRAMRDAAKERFLTMYAEVIGLVIAEFPRDKVMQDLLFDEVRAKAALAAADDATDAGDADADPA